MCSYNSFRGQPACANDELLGKVLRGEWGFGGYVVSDCGAVIDIHENHKARRTAAEGAAMALLAGTDLECGSGSWAPGSPDSFQALGDAVEQGLVKESDLDRALRRLFRAQVKLGVYDPPQRLPWAGYTYESVVDSPKHRQLALEAARKSIVLLKNENATLPLKKGLGHVAVIGPERRRGGGAARQLQRHADRPGDRPGRGPRGGGRGDEGDLRPRRAPRHGAPRPARRARLGALDGRRPARPPRRLLPRRLRRRARPRARGRRDRLRLGRPGARPVARRRLASASAGPGRSPRRRPVATPSACAARRSAASSSRTCRSPRAAPTTSP